MSQPAFRRGVSRTIALNMFVALSLSTMSLVTLPGEARRIDRTPVSYTLTIGAEEVGPPPVSGRQDGPLPPEIFR
jgi:hypothetical protein